MKLVIDIPDAEYERIQALDWKNSSRWYSPVSNAIHNGTPLPKGHGRLGDLDALEQEMINGIKAGNYEEGYEDYPNINSVDDCVELVRFADTIIEADKEGVGQE